MLHQRAPMPKKRATPRRNEGRIQHKRMSGEPITKTAAMKRYHDYVAALPCIACGCFGVHVHHVISDGFKRITRNHWLVLPMCAWCHTDGPDALHEIGTANWNAKFGIQQHVAAEQLMEHYRVR